MPALPFFLQYSDYHDNFTDVNCSGGVQWVWISVHDCVYNDWGVASVILGLLSLACWMIVGIPQIVMNCRDIHGIAGVSFFLLAQWTLGDTTNLVGSILTDQLPLQTYLAIYFVGADVVLLTQYSYYRVGRWRTKRRERALQRDSRAVMCFGGAFLSVCGIQSLHMLMRSDTDSYDTVNHPAGRSLLSTNLRHHSVFTNTTDEIGYAIGIISSILYIGSRSAQLWKNYKRKSTVGLSYLMFLLAVFGNLTYGAAILVRDLDGTYIIRHIPWLVGSLGVIGLDISLLIQFRIYAVLDEDHLREPLITETDYPAPVPGSVNSSPE